MNEIQEFKTELPSQAPQVLLATNGGLIYDQISQMMSEVSKVLLKALISLMGAKVARLYFLTDDLKFKIISNTKEKADVLSNTLIKRCFKFASHLNLDKGSTVSDNHGNSLGVLRVSCLLCPISIKDSPTAFGMIYLERSESQGNFSIESMNKVAAFSQTISRLLFQTSFHQDKSKFMLTFSTSILLLVENLKAKEAQLANSRLITHMVKISNMINSHLDLDTMLETIMNSAEMILSAESSSVMLVDEAKNELYFNLASGDRASSLKAIRVPIGEGIAGIVAETKKPLLVNNAQTDPRVFKKADEKTELYTRNILATPMLFQSRLIGVLEVINSIGRDEFSDSDLELLSTFSDQAALAIQNRELLYSMKKTNLEINKKLGELSTLYEIGKVLTSTLNRTEFFDSALRIMVEEIKIEYAAIIVTNKATESFEIISQIGEHEQPSKKEIEKLLHDEGQKVPSKKIMLPMRQGEDIYGYIYLTNKRDLSFFDTDDLRLIATVTNQVTKGVQNFNLLNDMLHTQAYENELKITSSLQRSLLPRIVANNPHYIIGCFSKSAKIMGGDFYDFFNIDQNNTVFVIADVSGKSLPAALFMAITYSTIRAISKLHSMSTAEVLGEANNLIYENSEAGMFVTLFYSIYNPHTHSLAYSSAGHNEQFLYRADQREFEALQCKGQPLGVIPSKESKGFLMKQVHVNLGDILIFYTDGVVESFNDQGEEFGTDRLKRVIEENYLLPPSQMTKQIYKEVYEFVGDQEQFDDITIMIVKILD